MVVVLLAVLCTLQSACLLAALVLFPAWVARRQWGLERQLRAFVESHDDQPSPLAILTDQMATLFAARMWQQVESRLRGAAGTVAREGQQVAEEQVAASGPLAALAMAFLPKKAKLMMVKNPQFLGALQALVAGAGKGSVADSNSSNGSAGQYRMKMEL